MRRHPRLHSHRLKSSWVPPLPTPQVFSESVQDLQTDYLDLMLLHYPECWGDLCGGVKPEGTWQDRCFGELVACVHAVWCGACQPAIATHCMREGLPAMFAPPHVLKPCPPAPPCPLPLPPACSWAALEQLMREKKLRAAGVSNFNLEQMKRLLEVAQVKPALLQSNSGGAPGAGGWAPLLGAADEGCRVSERNPAAGAVSAQRSYGARTAIIAAQLWPFRLPLPLRTAPPRLQTCCSRTGSCRPSVGNTASSSKHTPAWEASGWRSHRCAGADSCGLLIARASAGARSWGSLDALPANAPACPLTSLRGAWSSPPEPSEYACLPACRGATQC